MAEDEYKKASGQTGTTHKASTDRAMFLCLDKSGSMSGTPFTALKQGAVQIGKTIYDTNEF